MSLGLRHDWLALHCEHDDASEPDTGESTTEAQGAKTRGLDTSIAVTYSIAFV